MDGYSLHNSGRRDGNGSVVDIIYLDDRKRFTWIKYLKTNTIRMNLTELIATTVGIIGSIGGVGTLIYWRQNKLGSTSDALSKAFDALEKVTSLVDDQQEKHNKQMSQKDVVIEQLYEVIDQKTQFAMDNQDKIDKLTREWQERNYEFATMKRQIKGMQTIIDNFEARAMHAEKNICLVPNCDLRKPKLGTFKPK